jgi:hypothetical protein
LRYPAISGRAPPPWLAEQHRRFDRATTDELLLLRAVMPAAQMGATLNALAAPRRYSRAAPATL